MCCGVGSRRGSDPALLRLWYRPATTDPIQSLAWEPPYAAGAALKRPNKKERKAVSGKRGVKAEVRQDGKEMGKKRLSSTISLAESREETGK